MVALAKATAAAQERRRSEREALIEDVEWLLVTERPERIAERLDSTVAAIARRWSISTPRDGVTHLDSVMGRRFSTRYDSRDLDPAWSWSEISV